MKHGPNTDFFRAEGQAPWRALTSGTAPTEGGNSALTPALSPRERENRVPSFRQSRAPRPVAARGTVFPLPEGEGQGEGEAGFQLSATRRSPRGRENRRPRFGQSRAPRLVAARDAVLPLPEGEGQGEGEGGLQLSETRRFARRGAWFSFAHRPAVTRQRMRGALLQRPPNRVADGLLFAPQTGV